MDENLNFIDIISIFSLVLQMMNYQADLRSASNDDLMAELHKQNKEYLETIIEKQNLILNKLANLG